MGLLGDLAEYRGPPYDSPKGTAGLACCLLFSLSHCYYETGVCVCRRSGQCRSATSGEFSTIYWTRVGLRTVVATLSCDILTAYYAVRAASPLDRRSAASRVLLPVPLPPRASLTCPVHITHIIGTAPSAAVEILRRAATRRQPTRCS